MVLIFAELPVPAYNSDYYVQVYKILPTVYEHLYQLAKK